MAGRRILITGGGGFIGAHLIAKLTGAGDEIFSVSREVKTAAPEPVCEMIANLADEADCARLVTEIRPSHVVHLAAISSVAQSFGGGNDVWTNNFLPTWNLAKSVRELSGFQAFVFASTAEVYGAAFKTHPIAVEEGPTHPVNAYAHSKLAGELVIRDLLGALPGTVILRLFNTIGPGQDQRFVVASLAAQVAAIERCEAEPVLRVGNLQAERDFLDIEDTAGAIATVLARAPGFDKVQTFNVASGVARPVRAIVDALSALSTKPFRIEVDAARLRPVEIQSARGDSAKLTAATGWSPQRDWNETIRSVLDYWRSQPAG